MNNALGFSGSYAENEVRFLLEPVTLQDTPVLHKEALIQSGQKHYSELLTHETLPAEAYVNLFYEALALNQEWLATSLVELAERIVATRPKGITLVSLLRAGTPFGVLLKHILSRYFAIDAAHYSVSIIRDIGLDNTALQVILQRHAPESLVFIDGWTGKGVIAEQLTNSLIAFARQYQITIPAELYVVADVCGHATFSATTEDRLIPSCLLNATVSGLVSRSISPGKQARATRFHGCVYYEHFKAQDLSRYFVDTLLEQVSQNSQSPTFLRGNITSDPDRAALRTRAQDFIDWVIEHYQVTHTHFIKPGIGEATRVLLRRNPRLLLLQANNAPATEHLRWLADVKAIPIAYLPDCPFQAVAIIKEVS